MLKLYKKLRPVDWVLLAVLMGLTVLQVSCTMTLVDYIRKIIESITFLNYHNNPALLGEEFLQAVNNYGWEKLPDIFAQHVPAE